MSIIEYLIATGDLVADIRCDAPIWEVWVLADEAANPSYWNTGGRTTAGVRSDAGATSLYAAKTAEARAKWDASNAHARGAVVRRPAALRASGGGRAPPGGTACLDSGRGGQFGLKADFRCTLG